VRTADGPRQRTLCHLGELNDSAQARWLNTIEVFNDAGERHQLKLFPSEVAPPPDDAEVAQVLVQRVRLERTRQLGPALLGLALWQPLRLDEFFEMRVDAARADVPWSRVAAILAINRLCAPGSELAIIDGFPLSDETFDGNRADVTSLETVMRMVERQYGQARRVWVFDRGIVRDANLAAIRRRGGQYLVGTRRTTLRPVERALREGSWTQVREEVEAQLVPIPGGTETYVLCRSTARREKALAIRRRFSGRLEDRLRGLETRVATGRLQDRAKIERGLGRLHATYASVADLYEMAVRDEDGQRPLHWTLIEDRRAWRDAREGAYLLRTNLVGQTVEELWTKYIQLTEAEAAFRALKSELSGGLLAVGPLFDGGRSRSPRTHHALSAESEPGGRALPHPGQRTHPSRRRQYGSLDGGRG